VAWRGLLRGGDLHAVLSVRRQLVSGGAAALVLTLVLAAPAGAVVVPQRGMKGVRLGWTKAQVRGELGSPDRFIVRRNEITGHDLAYRYGLTEVVFAARGTRVTAITTTSRRERTARGVGIGSTAATVAARVPGARCTREAGVRHCHVGAFLPGRTVTDFLLNRRGRVKRIVVGRVID
jgi:hypothetical protein